MRVQISSQVFHNNDSHEITQDVGTTGGMTSTAA